MWDGKVQSAGINPYRYAPDSPQLEQLHSTILPRMVNHPEKKTLYFPFSQWLFFVCYQLSGEDIWGYKLLIVLSEGLTILGLLLLTRHLRLPDQAVLLYALCPLPIVQFAGDAHIDAVGLPLLIFGLLAYAKGYRGRAALLLGFSMAVKPVALIILPALFLQEQNTKGRLMILLTPPLVLLLQFAPYLVAANPFDALGTFTANWTFNGIAFDFLNLFISDNQRARIVCGILLVLSLFLLYVRKKEFFERAYYSVLLLLLFSPVVHPWYVTWLAVLLPPVQRWSGIVFVSTVSLAGITAMQYRLTGEWEQTQAVLIIEYLPVIALLVLELWRGTGAPWRSSNSAMA
jgi:hypothetical protein